MDKLVVKGVLTSKPFAVAVGSIAAGSAGFTVAWLVLSKRLEVKYAAISEQEIQDAKTYYEKNNKVGEYADPVALAEALEAGDSEEVLDMMGAAKVLASNEGYISYDKPQTVEDVIEEKVAEAVAQVEPTVVNVFTNFDPTDNDGGFDLDDELEKKSRGVPYIVEHDQFFENADELTENDLTWFEGDQVLVDEKDNPIRNYEGVLGLDNLKFGRGSKDANTVYIVNPRHQASYRVVRSEGLYTEEVLGVIQHSDRRSRSKPKFRNLDD